MSSALSALEVVSTATLNAEPRTITASTKKDAEGRTYSLIYNRNTHVYEGFTYDPEPDLYTQVTFYKDDERLEACARPTVFNHFELIGKRVVSDPQQGNRPREAEEAASEETNATSEMGEAEHVEQADQAEALQDAQEDNHETDARSVLGPSPSPSPPPPEVEKAMLPLLKEFAERVSEYLSTSGSQVASTQDI